jgi:hypothetical protein
MDYPLQRRKPTWRDSLYFEITINSLAACAIVMVMIPLMLAAFQSAVGFPATLRVSVGDIIKTTVQFVLLWGLPYVWMSFLALEKARLRMNGGSGRDWRV